jgi:cytochrome c556
MTSGRIWKAMAAGAIILGIGAGLAYAATADEQIAARQAHMKANGAAAGAFAKVLKGEAPYDAAVVKTALDEIAAKSKAADDVKAWDAASAKGDKAKTYAKPEVWSDPKGFEQAYQAYVKATTDLAATKDEASFKTAFAAWGGSCKGCHEKFRAPKE